MAFKLESNPLEQNALFNPPPAEEQGSAPKAAQKSSKRTKKQPVKKETLAEEVPQSTAQSTQSDAPFVRATFIVRRDLLKQLKDYAYTERREIKDVVNEILETSMKRVHAEYAKRGEKIIEK